MVNFQITAVALLSSATTQPAERWKLKSSFCSKGPWLYLHCYLCVQLGIQTFFCIPQWFSSTEIFFLLCFIFTDLILFFQVRNIFVLPAKSSSVIELACCGQYSGVGAGGASCKLLDRNTSPRQPGVPDRPCSHREYTNTGLERREAAPEDHITAKNFILIWLQKKQDEGSAMWSEFRASASWGLRMPLNLSLKVLLDKTEALF